MKKVLAFWFFFLILSLSLLPQKKIVHEVKVKAQIIPVYAINTKGMPVFDLRKEDIEVYLDNKKISFNFYPVVFEQDLIVNRQELSHPKVPIKKRLIFVIVDSMFNSIRGAIRSKTIVEKLIQKGLRGDQFVILENKAGGGLKVIAGFDYKKKELLEKIQNYKFIPDKYPEKLFFGKDQETLDPKDPQAPDLFLKFEEKRYRFQSEVFANSLSSLKYMLKNNDDSKLVFLLSEGIARGALNLFVSMSKYIKQISEAVNEGGAVLHTINPRIMDFKDIGSTTVSGDFSLQIIAHESGGKYFEGGNTERIIEDIKKVSSAYYELSFEISPDQRKQQKLRIKCLKKGTTLINPQITSRDTPYSNMKKIEKKILAHSILTSGARTMFGKKVIPAVYRLVEINKNLDQAEVSLEIEIPREMQNRIIDVFIFKEGLKSQSLAINLISERTKNKFRHKIIADVKNRVHLVIIDPKTTNSIFINKDILAKEKDFFLDLPRGRTNLLSMITPPEDIFDETDFSSYSFEEGREDSKLELKGILKKAAAYCEKLKSGVFHYFCKEKIIEKYQSLPRLRWGRGRIYKKAYWKGKLQLNYDYQIKKLSKSIKESRTLIKTDGKKVNVKDAKLRTRYFSNFSSFGPISLLSKEQQQNFTYLIVDRVNIKGQKAVVLETKPITGSMPGRNYGKVWINKADGSVMRLQTTPDSIPGHKYLRNLALRKKAKLDLKIIHEYNILHQGLRYPSKTEFIETFIYVEHLLGKHTRTHTTFEYFDYRFFNVKTETTLKINQH